MKENELLDMLGEDGFKSSFYTFFTVVDNAVVKCDKSKLEESYRKSRPTNDAEEQKPRRRGNRYRLEEFEAIDFNATKDSRKQDTTNCENEKEQAMTQEEKYQEGRKYDTFSGFGVNSATAEHRKAFRWYKAAAEEGHLATQILLGLLYQCGFDACEIDKEKALYWYTMAAFNEEYNEHTADADTTVNYSAAQSNLKDLELQVTNGKELVRKYVGDKADAIIRAAELERIAKETVAFHQDYIRDFIEGFRKKYW